MTTGNPTFNELKQEKEPILNEQGKEALKELKVILGSYKIPNEERQGYADRLVLKIDGQTDEDMIDMAAANITLEIVKRGRQIKDNKEDNLKKQDNLEKEEVCTKCGIPTIPGDNFCRKCGNILK